MRRDDRKPSRIVIVELPPQEAQFVKERKKAPEVWGSMWGLLFLEAACRFSK
jgi:hypothetical protein